MKILSFSLLILVVYHPLLSSGLKCYTCNRDEDRNATGSAICFRDDWLSGRQLGIVECPGMVCTVGEDAGLEPTHLGCELRDNVDIPSIKTYQGSDPICGDNVKNFQSGMIQCICQTDLCNKPSSLKCLSCRNGFICSKEEALKPSESRCQFNDVCMHMKVRSRVGGRDIGEVSMGCFQRAVLQNIYSKRIDKPTGYYIGSGEKNHEGEWELYLCNSDLCNTHYRDPNHPEDPYKNAGSSDPKILPFTLTLAVYLVSVYYS